MSSSFSSLKRHGAADGYDERPAKRLKLVEDLTVEPEQPCPEVEAAEMKWKESKKRRDDARDLLNASDLAVKKMQQELEALVAKVEKDEDAFSDARDGEVVMYTAYLSARAREETKQKFWALVGRFLHDGEHHVSCKEHNDYGGCFGFCLWHPMDRMCGYECDEHRKTRPQCPGCFSKAAPGAMMIIRSPVKGHCDQFYARHDQSKEIHKWRSTMWSTIRDEPELAANGLCGDCQEKVTSLVAFKTNRVTTLVALMAESLPKEVVGLASQYLVYSHPSCWTCKVPG